MLPPTPEEMHSTVIANKNIINNKNMKLQHRRTLSGNNNQHSCSRRYAEIGSWKVRGDAFLEPYMQGLQSEFTSHHLHQSSPGSQKDTDDVIGSRTDDVCDTSTNHNTNNIADLGQFRLLDIDGSADSLDQDLHSDISSSASSDNGDSGSDTPCDIGLVERLIRSHPVWFLPGIQRAGAFHLLQGKEEGNFVVRQSSQPDTMAISVRLPMGKGPYIEHYLIQSCDGQLSLESSDNRFESIPSLIAHYSQCCDELPVQLTLPRAMREAKNRQQLSSLALLGQEFWRYPMANPRLPDRSDASNGHHARGFGSPPSSGSSLSSFGSGNNNQGNESRNRTPTVEQGTDPIVLNLAPLCGEQPHSIMSTFKGSSPVDLGSPASPTSSLSGLSGYIVTTTSATHITTSQISRPRPTPPNTLSLACSASPSPISGMRSSSNSPAQMLSPPATNGVGPLALKTPPPPPPRWAKPAALSSLNSPSQNIVVTTTVTFNVNHPSTPPPHVEVSCVQGAPKRPQIEMENVSPLSSLELRPARIPQVMSPTTPAGTPNGDQKHIRTKKHRPSHSRQASIKESHHYQESDILESPTTYYRSSVADKISDYEDVWGPDMLTFKPHAMPRSSPFSSPEDVSLGSYGIKKTPDILERVGTPVSGSCASLNSVKETQRNRLGLVINTSTSNTNSPMSPVASDPIDPVLTPPPAKQGSPFYAEPADALRQAALVPRRRPQLFQNQSRNRHSDPTLVWPSNHHGGVILERIDSSEELPTQGLSSSVDNLAALRNSRNGGKPKGKPVQPPRIRPRPGHLGGKSFTDASWAVDSSWEFIGKEGEEDEDDDDEDVEFRDERERRFPTLEQQETTLDDVHSQGVKKITVQELIAQRFPALRLSPDILHPSLNSNYPTSPLEFGSGSATISSRISSYDNVEGRNGHSDSSNNHSNHCSSRISDSDDASTLFSEPWDSSRWETLLDIKSKTETSLNGTTNSAVQIAGARPILNDSEDNTRCEPMSRSNGNVGRAKSFKERLDPLLSPPRLQALRNRDAGGTGASIRAYALHLAGDKSTTFAQNIDNFIACTRESRETSPQIVMRNMRQFMSGMKNYLVKHGEREFEKEVEKERMKLKATEFLNLDAILEGVMHKLVVRPLKEHLYKLFVDEYTRSGAIQLLADNIDYARTKPLLELGIRAKIVPPTERSLETICHYLTSLQEVDSPLEKLENLLTCISAIFNSVKSSNQGRGCITLGADDFLPLFVWVLVQSNMVAAEIEAEYMWGLLHPSLLSGEGGYYLTTLSSAVHVLKNFRACSEEQSRSIAAGGSLDWQSGSLTEFRSVLKIVVPDEMHGSIITKTLPVRPNMTTRDVCKIIAHKVRITNPQDYGLFKLVDGEETLLSDGECPQDVKGNVTQVGKHVMFAYKRIDAKIAWPRTSSPQ